MKIRQVSGSTEDLDKFLVVLISVDVTKPFLCDKNINAQLQLCLFQAADLGALSRQDISCIINLLVDDSFLSHLRSAGASLPSLYEFLKLTVHHFRLYLPDECLTTSVQQLDLLSGPLLWTMHPTILSTMNHLKETMVLLCQAHVSLGGVLKTRYPEDLELINIWMKNTPTTLTPAEIFSTLATSILILEGSESIRKKDLWQGTTLLPVLGACLNKTTPLPMSYLNCYHQADYDPKTALPMKYGLSEDNRLTGLGNLSYSEVMTFINKPAPVSRGPLMKKARDQLHTHHLTEVPLNGMMTGRRWLDKPNPHRVYSSVAAGELPYLGLLVLRQLALPVEVNTVYRMPVVTCFDDEMDQFLKTTRSQYLQDVADGASRSAICARIQLRVRNLMAKCIAQSTGFSYSEEWNTVVAADKTQITIQVARSLCQPHQTSQDMQKLALVGALHSLINSVHQYIFNLTSQFAQAYSLQKGDKTVWARHKLAAAHKLPDFAFTPWPPTYSEPNKTLKTCCDEPVKNHPHQHGCGDPDPVPVKPAPKVMEPIKPVALDTRDTKTITQVASLLLHSFHEQGVVFSTTDKQQAMMSINDFSSKPRQWTIPYELPEGVLLTEPESGILFNTGLHLTLFAQLGLEGKGSAWTYSPDKKRMDAIVIVPDHSTAEGAKEMVLTTIVDEGQILCSLHRITGQWTWSGGGLHMLEVCQPPTGPMEVSTTLTDSTPTYQEAALVSGAAGTKDTTSQGVISAPQGQARTPSPSDPGHKEASPAKRPRQESLSEGPPSEKLGVITPEEDDFLNIHNDEVLGGTTEEDSMDTDDTDEVQEITKIVIKECNEEYTRGAMTADMAKSRYHKRDNDPIMLEVTMAGYRTTVFMPTMHALLEEVYLWTEERELIERCIQRNVFVQKRTRDIKLKALQHILIRIINDDVASLNANREQILTADNDRMIRLKEHLEEDREVRVLCNITQYYFDLFGEQRAPMKKVFQEILQEITSTQWDKVIVEDPEGVFEEEAARWAKESDQKLKKYQKMMQRR